MRISTLVIFSIAVCISGCSRRADKSDLGWPPGIRVMNSSYSVGTGGQRILRGTLSNQSSNAIASAALEIYQYGADGAMLGQIRSPISDLKSKSQLEFSVPLASDCEGYSFGRLAVGE